MVRRRKPKARRPVKRSRKPVRRRQGKRLTPPLQRVWGYVPLCLGLSILAIAFRNALVLSELNVCAQIGLPK